MKSALASGANYCLDRIYQGAKPCVSTKPATAGAFPVPHHQTRCRTVAKIVIVGAGPRGVGSRHASASARGHEVVVLEAANRAGGQLLLTAAHKSDGPR